MLKAEWKALGKAPEMDVIVEIIVQAFCLLAFNAVFSVLHGVSSRLLQRDFIQHTLSGLTDEEISERMR